MERSQFIDLLVHRINEFQFERPVRVAIDGPDAAGKTTLANELVKPLQALGRPVIRASVDGFHNPARLRHARGAESPEGYFYDSFNHQTLIDSLLAPLGPNGSGRYSPAAFDYHTDTELRPPLEMAEPKSILLFDGVFLLRPELARYWDFTIFVDVSFETVLTRAKQRDAIAFGGVEETTRRYQRRYIPGQQLYFTECQPKTRADLVIDNNDPLNPVVL